MAYAPIAHRNGIKLARRAAVGGAILSVGLTAWPILEAINSPKGASLNVVLYWVFAMLAMVGLCAIGHLLSTWFPSREKHFCESCKKCMPGDSVWKCGHCDFVNRRTRAFPFAHHCEKCGRAPCAVLCHRCAHPLIIDHRDSTGIPALLVDESSREKQTAPIQLVGQEHEERTGILRREIEVASLERRLAQIRSSPEFQKELSEQERIGRKYSEFEAQKLGVKLLERECRRSNAQISDPEIREMKEMVMDEFVQSEGMDPTRYNE